MGCGGMGRRHLSGYAALARSGLWQGDLVAVYDLRVEAAQALADDAERLLGRRPVVHTDLDGVLADEWIAALDLVTDPSSHHAIAVPALRRGRHVLSEKPLGLTMRACQAMLDAAREGGAVLATAENYRRGGPNRMARAVVDAGLLGRLHLMVQLMVGGSDRVLITPWRHLKQSGSIALDMGVHLTDLVEFYLGPVETAYGRGIVAEPVRRSAEGDAVHATGEDSLLAQLRTTSGVEVQLAYVPSGPGLRYVQRTIHGSAGSMVIPRDRTDGEVEVHRADGVLRGADLRAALGDAFTLDQRTVALLGPDGTGGDVEFAEIDAGYLAVEIADFVDAVLTGRPPEVDGLAGARAVAGVLAVLESGVAGAPVRVEDVLSGAVHAYQDEIDEGLDLLAGSGEVASR
ncbi:Gfo/Idh/MocA family oxidoreductase [Actinopolymorpha pittospori]|uniref:Dehydrogenase n=1 Tax=Actinopolymorpha pittospori TaxID=648752 RepID=A0A927MWD2_9ACTN|nr:putative dehydrogenase [Actinopolymorpha pittospori]